MLSGKASEEFEAFVGRDAVFSHAGNVFAYKDSPSTFVIRDTDETVGLIQVDVQNEIEALKWSPGDDEVLAVTGQEIQIYGFDGSLNLSIQNGPFRIVDALWSPDGQGLLLLGEASAVLFFYRFDGNLKYLPPPKEGFETVKFSFNGSHIGILSRISGKDALFTFTTGRMQSKKPFELSTVHARTFEWSLDGKEIAVPDSACHYFLEIVDTKNNTSHTHMAYEGALGISCTVFCPNSKLLAVGGFDGVIRILVAPEWRVLAEFTHVTTYTSCAIPILTETGMGFESVEPPFEAESSNKNGFKLIKWSPTGLYLAVVCNNTPNLIHIWNAETTGEEVVIVFHLPITSIEWSPNANVLAITTDRLYFWSKTGISPYPLNSSLSFDTIEWNSTSDHLFIADKEAGKAILISNT